MDEYEIKDDYLVERGWSKKMKQACDAFLRSRGIKVKTWADHRNDGKERDRIKSEKQANKTK